MQTINVGDTLTCSETGEQFIAACDGCTVNYARTGAGEILSDAGAVIRERRELLDRTKPFVCYVDRVAGRVTTWKGHSLGAIINYRESRAGWHCGTIARFRVRDIHGQWWSGRGAGHGMCCTLRAMKAPK